MQSYNFWNYTIQITEKNDFDLETQEYPILQNTLIGPKQIHSNTIYEYYPNRDTPKWDGVFSDQKEITLSVGARDCNAVVIMGKRRYGILHVGRKWLRDGIIQTMISRLEEKGESDFTVFIWPSIRACCYEVGQEFANYFKPQYLIPQDNGKYKLDMIANIIDILKESNIWDITIHPTCTKCSTNFFSHRKWDWINNLISVQKRNI